MLLRGRKYPYSRCRAAGGYGRGCGYGRWRRDDVRGYRPACTVAVACGICKWDIGRSENLYTEGNCRNPQRILAILWRRCSRRDFPATRPELTAKSDVSAGDRRLTIGEDWSGRLCWGAGRLMMSEPVRCCEVPSCKSELDASYVCLCARVFALAGFSFVVDVVLLLECSSNAHSFSRAESFSRVKSVSTLLCVFCSSHPF